MSLNFSEVRELIDQSTKIILTTHVVPDGDAIGSECALFDYLKLKGKNPIILNHSQTPLNLQFLDKKDSICIFPENEDKNKRLIEEADVIFILDTNEYSRTKSLEQYILNSSAKKVCIDHHIGIDNDLYTAVISNVFSSATCQILYDFIKADSESFITPEIASSLYVGIMTDTGSFRHPRTNADVFIICADLINKGADPVQLYDNVYATTTIENLQLLAKFIKSFEFYNHNKVVIGTVTQEDFSELGLDIQHVEGFTSILMNIKSIKLGIVMVELKDNIKVSFRSKGEIHVNELAREFSGGGHKNAAGANVKYISVPELRKEILKKVESLIE